MIDLSKKRFLVVDDFSEFRSSIRGILRLLGVQQIDTAANGDDVMELCRRNRYDVILHDYNLGEGVSGQQVLEQLHAEKLLSAHCIFIMVTAENTQAMVLAAIECEPDDYLTKPFNKVALQTRLERVVKRKEILRPVLTAVENNQPEAVLQACQQIEQQEPRHAVLCLRYKAATLEQLSRYTELEQLLEQQARSRPTGWNLQSLAYLWLCQGREEQVSGLLSAAIRQFPMLPDLHDIQANLAARRLDLVQEQQSLEKAVSLSPNNIRRQIRLAHQSWLNNQPEIATHALHQCWEIGRYSPIFTPQLIWQLASMLAASASTPRQNEEVNHWIRIIERQYSQSPNTQAATSLLKLAIRKKAGHDISTQDLNPLLDELTERQSCYSGISLLMLGDWLEKLGANSQAKSFWQRSAIRYALVPGILTQVKQRLPEFDDQPYLQAHKLYIEAVAKHLRGEPEAATPLFIQAQQLAPHLVRLNIAAARLALDQIKQGNSQARSLMQTSLEQIDQLPAIDLQILEYKRLKSAQELHAW